MGTSGNPAKEARKRTIAEVRAAVASGKTAVLTPWADTTVTIKTTNPDYAESVISFIEVMDPRSRDVKNMSGLFGLLEKFIHAYMVDPANDKAIKAWLRQLDKDFCYVEGRDGNGPA